MDLFSTSNARAGLKAKTVRGAVVTGAAQAIRIGVGLASIPLLARLLDPSDFGLFAIVAVVTNFALMFVDAGLSLATIQRDEVTPGQVSNLFWFSTGLGVAIALLVSAFGPVLSLIYDEPRLIWLMAVCSLSYVFTGLTIQHQALLRRNLMFNQIALIEIFSLLVGQAAAIGWAYGAAGQSGDYWALAWVPVGTTAARMVGVWIACRWVPLWFRRGNDAGQMLKFGGNLTYGLAFNYAGSHFDLLMIGYLFGDVPLGNYERSTMLSLQPTRQINGPMSSICVPVLSRLLDSPARYFHAYRTSVTLVFLVVVPIASVFVVHAELVIANLLGDGWEAAVPIFRIMSLALFTLPMCNASAWLLISQGRGRELFHFQAFDSLLKILFVIAAIPWGVIGIAVACVSRAVVVAPILFYVIGRSGSVRTKQIQSLFGVQLLALAFTAMAIWLLRWNPSINESRSIVTLGLVVTVATIVSSAVFLSFPFVRSGLREVVGSIFNATSAPTETSVVE